MSEELSDLFSDNAVTGYQDLEARVRHLERLEPSISAPIAGSGLSLAIATKTTTYTILLTDFNILADATAGSFAVTLPAAADTYDSVNNIGQLFNLMKTDTGPNSVTLTGDGAELIYSVSSPTGSNTLIITAPLESITVQSNGTSYYVW